VVVDPASKRAAVIDPVLDFDLASGRTSTASADQVLGFIADNDLGVDWILETHVHADHLTGAPYIREKAGGQIAIGRHVTAVQQAFRAVFNLADLATDGSQFDNLFDDGDSFKVGGIAGNVLGTPGHTPACITYVVGDAAFVGDTLFMPDFGSARTDFPGGDAGQLYDSIHRIFSLPDDTRLFMCHDYKAPGRDEFAWETSVRDIAMRDGRDAELGMPKLILPSIQVNVRAGALPAPEDNGIRYVKIPVDAL
jgi:glyoxylase-like metal-dependent hydrolase (beta-lactamase superfamily II)